MPKKRGARFSGQTSDHSTELIRFNRIKGQIEGVERMIREKRYCGDILQQLRAAKAGISAIEASVLKTYLHTCVSEALRTEKQKAAKERVDEVIDLFKHTTSKGVVIT